MDTLGKMFDDGYRKNAVACKCKDWPRLQGMLAEHHENCIHHNLRKDAITQITNLVRGIEAWAVFKKDNEEFLWSEPCLPAHIFTESAFICEPVTIYRNQKQK